MSAANGHNLDALVRLLSHSPSDRLGRKHGISPVPFNGYWLGDCAKKCPPSPIDERWRCVHVWSWIQTYIPSVSIHPSESWVSSSLIGVEERVLRLSTLRLGSKTPTGRSACVESHSLRTGFLQSRRRHQTGWDFPIKHRLEQHTSGISLESGATLPQNGSGCASSVWANRFDKLLGYCSDGSAQPQEACGFSGKRGVADCGFLPPSRLGGLVVEPAICGHRRIAFFICGHRRLAFFKRSKPQTTEIVKPNDCMSGHHGPDKETT